MFFLDIETFNELDLRKVALDRYASHPSARILMLAYAGDGGEVDIWQEGEDKTALVERIQREICVPWNKAFEETNLEKIWNVKAAAWDDAMIRARYAGLPSGLKDCNRVPFFASEAVTSKETLLINKFCKPAKKGIIHDRTTDPEDWAAFCDYCKRDVADTRLIYQWFLKHYDFPERVFQGWLLDQAINRRGVPIDRAFVWNANLEAARLQEISHQRLTELTGLENANSPKQLLGWLEARGYPYNSLGKELVQKAMEEMPDGEAKAACKLRLDGAKASVKKLAKILEQISPDGRLREQYSYYKAHTGRWAGKGAQLQNLKAPRTKEEKAAVDRVVRAILAGGQVANLDELTLSLRPAIYAPKGKKVVLADFSSVENRWLAWLADSEPMLEVYRQGKDPYIDFATRMYELDYAEVSKEQRQIAKPGTLGCGFGLGGGKEVRYGHCSVTACKHRASVELTTQEGLYPCPKCGAQTFKIGQIQKTGLWKYAEQMGISMSQEDAHKQVAVFREAFTDVCKLWYYLETAFYFCAKTHREQTVGAVKFIYRDPAVRIVLPSGRELVYNCPIVHMGYENGHKTLELAFYGTKGKSWCFQYTYGGKICENVVQACALDSLVDAMQEVEASPRYELIAHTHDEIVTLADEGDTGALPALETIMSRTPSYAPGLIMKAEGFEGPRYTKG